MDYAYWIALSNLKNFSSKEKYNLVKVFGSAKAIFHSRFLDIQKNTRLSNEKINNLLNTTIDYNADEKLFSKGVKICCLNEIVYPKLLSYIYSPPVLLYYRGEIPKIPCIAVVGSRKTTKHGRENSFEISKFLASKGFCITSGLARGIDSCAHHGALEAGITTAVLGSGINICYPPENKYLMDRIEENGCVISEFPINKNPSKYTFPSRNRIISGLSEAVIVVEAAKKSGSLITAEFALDQGRDVFAFKNGHTELSKGTDSIISDGAYPINNVDEFIEIFC